MVIYRIQNLIPACSFVSFMAFCVAITENMPPFYFLYHTLHSESLSRLRTKDNKTRVKKSYAYYCSQ